MRIKLDENLPTSAAVSLRGLGHDVDTVPEEGLKGFADPDVWAATQTESRFFITQDLDFSDLRAFRPGTHAGLLLLRLHSQPRRVITEQIELIFRTEDVATWAGCFVVVHQHKIRIFRPDERAF